LGIAIVCLVFYEDHYQHIPWAAHIPGFLKVSGPSVQNTLRASFREYTNIYRAKATFNTGLSLAEYLSLLTPTFLYFGFSTKNPWLKAGAFLMVPTLFVAIRMTDARLGVVGMLVSVLLYGCLWSVVRWRSRPGDLLAAATVYGYPAVFFAGVGAVFASTRLNQMVFGGGAQAGSTAARQTQLAMAMESLSHAPWGYGTGGSGMAMGFSEREFITIDNYFIAVVLDYGALGAALWYGTFLIGIFYALRYCLPSKYAATREARLLAPLAITLIAFLVIKWVHGQDENHPVYFMMLGMISALVLRIRNRQLAAQLTEPFVASGR
jgi:hypothetical protein